MGGQGGEDREAAEPERVGPYVLGEIVGRGGMAVVYEGLDAQGREVAVKRMHAHLVGDETLTARFEREAELAALVRHPNVVAVLDAGLDASGAPYLVMERVRGRNLGDVLEEEAPLSIERALAIAGDVLDGLAALHAVGAVHRDLKPENVLLEQVAGAERARIADLGIVSWGGPSRGAAAGDGTGDELTPVGLTMGTPRYCAPEQLAGDGARDPRVDLYAVGLLAFEMIAAEGPFRGADLAALCRAIEEDPPPPLAAFRRGVPPAVERAIARALAKRPEDRYPDAAAMRAALAG